MVTQADSVVPMPHRWEQQLQATQPIPAARILAVTGTNGKTTISRLVAELLMLQGKNVPSRWEPR